MRRISDKTYINIAITFLFNPISRFARFNYLQRSSGECHLSLFSTLSIRCTLPTVVRESTIQSFDLIFVSNSEIIALQSTQKGLSAMHLILTGATGLIGSSVLDAMLKTAEVTKISILSRRPVAMAENAKDPRVNVIIHKDFLNYDSEVLSKLQGASGAVWALGISQTKVSKEYVT